MVTTSICPEPGVIARWSETLEGLHQRIAHRFARVEVRERVHRYLAGLLDRVERKNGWQLAEAIGEFGAKGAQRLLNAAAWDADMVRDDLRDYVIEHLGDDASGILIVDETGFLKKGMKSCGVARQYTGTAGDTVNCPVGVFLAYASAHGSAFIDRSLYLPREWATDPDRRTAAGIPVGVRFASKITLAERMLARAFAADVPARWVVADSFYGRSGPFRRWLEERDQPYAVMIPRTNAIDYRVRRIRVEQVAEHLPASDSPPWLCLALSEEGEVDMRHWLLVRRDADDRSDDAYWLAYGPAGTTEEELVRVCDTRWRVEECFAQAKGEVGMDEYEVRTWTAWHRFVTLCLLAHAFLIVMRHAARREETAEKGAVIPALSR
jgi:SRSO17 transposase